MDKLPDEILLHLLSYLHPRELVMVMSLSSKFKLVAKDDKACCGLVRILSDELFQ
jgi:F-box-like